MSTDFHTRTHRDLNKPIAEFRANDLRHATINKTNLDQPNGLVIERKAGSKEFYIKDVPKDGIFYMLHKDRIRAGDRLVKVNDKNVEDFMSLWDINDYLKKQTQITVFVKREGLHLEKKSEWNKPQYTETPLVAPSPYKSIDNKE